MAAKRKTPSTDAARLADLKAARRAIGDTHASRLAWVVRFVAENPATWHPAVRVAHGDCLHMVALHGVVSEEKAPDPMAPDDVEALHHDLRAKLRDLLGKNPTRTQMVDIPTEGQTEVLIRLTHAGAKPAMFATSRGQVSLRTAVFQAVKDLILQAGERLIACPSCGTPFLYNRKQMFCKVTCAQKVRNDRRDAKRPRKTERRRKGK
jgi:hypothetical protein